jgi:D-alanyl-lipoteichoic acid acyltransferase DltB (MBOAT superfamily)
MERSASARARKSWLLASLVTNLGFMASFKYSGDIFGRSPGVIPIGLSFHTFQAMAYTIEVYRGRQAAERSFTTYALYVMFFPQIAAGPIERPQNLLPQFRKPHSFDYAEVVAGLQLMAWGMFQKYVVADHLARVVTAVYNTRGGSPGPLTAFAAVCFSFQIFCDFAGYSDIALGAAQVLGFRLTRNFNSPFHADSMAEYWKRWHISLSSWMRDYVFFPLCGRRPRMPRICASIMVVFLANAVWHGLRWNYIVEGLLHGTYRTTELLAGRALSRTGWTVSAFWNLPLRIGRTLLVFSLMTVAFIFFRADSLAQSFQIVAALFSGWRMLLHAGAMAAALAQANVSASWLAQAAGWIAIVEAVQWLRATGPLRPRIAALPVWWRWSLYYGAASSLLILAHTGQPFLYFRF